MRLLFVENHARFARLTVAQFLAAHDVLIVSSIAAAHEALSGAAFDAALIDYDLDDGKGDELVRGLRRENRHIKIVADSSHQDGNHALVAAGADAVCSKMQFSMIEDVLSSLFG